MEQDIQEEVDREPEEVVDVEIQEIADRDVEEWEDHLLQGPGEIVCARSAVIKFHTLQDSPAISLHVLNVILY